MSTCVSVIIPNHNRALLVRETIESILSQSLPPHEVIVVDDGSTDGSRESIRSFGPRVTLIEQSNQGPGAARNAGLRVATGDFVQFMDSDDLLTSGSLQAGVSTLERSGADIAIGRRIRTKIGGKRTVPSSHVIQQKGLPRGHDLVYWLLTHWSIMPPQMLFRRSIIEKAGGFPEDLWVAEDQEFFLRLLLAGARAVWCPDFFMIYRDDNTDKLSESALSRKVGDWAKFLLRARGLCLASSGKDPMDWFGYRLRLWKAYEDLRDIPDRAGLRKEIEALPGIVSRRSLYRLSHRLDTLRGGLNQRLFGDRNHACSRAGKPTPAQLRLIAQSLPVLNENK